MPSKHFRTDVCKIQAYSVKRLLEMGTDPALETPSTQEECVAGLMAEINQDSPDGITVSIGPNQVNGTISVPIDIAHKVDDLADSESPTFYVLANHNGNATYIRYVISRAGEKPRMKQGAQRPLWFDMKLREPKCWEFQRATMASLETSLLRAGIRNPKIVQKKGKHDVKKFEFHVTFSGVSLHGDPDPAHFPWWNLKAQHDGTSEGIPFATPAREALWYATVFQISPEIIQLADIKTSCFHPTKLNCICALAAKNRMKQASYVPLAKRQKQSETSHFFKSRAETLNHWKNQAKSNNGKAASSSNNQGDP
mmetsp:Transcript_18194/g.38546  ORF Transcript_18194/g.38546 Transcript_18194/m.38546 type:complete len:310 (-) Transcript_18194:407-1336(-)